MRAAGIPPLSGDRTPEQDAEALWVAAETLTADPALGLKVGAQVRYSTYATLGHVLVTSRTVGQALSAACELAFYVGAAGRLHLRTLPDGASITYQPLRPGWRAANVRSEAVLLPFARFARWAAPGVAPRVVHLMRPPPADPDAFTAAFGAPVMFGAEAHAIFWSAEALARPMTDANPALNDMLRQHVQAELAADAPAAALTEQVNAHLATALAHGATAPSLDRAAKALGMSARSFQRALAEEHTTFRQLLADARMGRAADLLRGTPRQVADVAEALGYSEPAAFVRAFRRHHGLSPAAWRKKMRG
jgi:AraC-like DNA-binding protein